MNRRLFACLFLLAFTTVSGAAFAGPKIGVVSPTGNESLGALGDQLRQGVAAYQATAGKPFDAIVTAPEACDAASGKRAAKTMADAKVSAVIGFLCPESLNAALPILSKAGITTIGTSVRAEILMEDANRNDWPFYRIAPHNDQEVQTIVDVITKRWASAPFALVDDGTIYGRELAENVRVRLSDLGITPAFTDTYRPAQDKQFGLAHRLERAGVTHIFVGGERPDIAVIARDCAAIGLDLTIMGGDSLKAAPGDVDLADGVLGVMTPAPDTLPSAKDALGVLAKQGIEPYGDVIPGYAAAELVAEASKTGKPLPDALADGTFDTALGKIRFTAKHERTDNPFELMVWRDDHFAPVDGEGVGMGE